MKTVGIITMHRVLNYGSALQAYATQTIIGKLGYSPMIIDYRFPGKELVERLRREKYEQATSLSGKFRNSRLWKMISKWKHSLCYHRKKTAFQKFWIQELKLTSPYSSQEALKQSQPLFDIYLTGSDQVWNPLATKGDTVFMCDFAPKTARIVSYSASFSTANIPSEFWNTYAQALGRYKTITCREQTGCDLAEKLTGSSARLVCDPVILLDSEAWADIAKKSNLKLPDSYLLVYVLTYAYDPYPYVNDIILHLHNKTGLPVLLLEGKAPACPFTYAKAADPYDFVKLFQNATMAITTSFHGTAFALIFGTPFYAVMQSDLNRDSRMASLLEKTHNRDNGIFIGAPIKQLPPKPNNRYVESFKQESLTTLNEMLSSIS